MYLDKRQKNIVKQALNDYDFIKEELNEKINKDYNMEDLSIFLTRFKDIEITNFDIYDDFGYLDFIYKDINTCVIWSKDAGIRVSNTLEIYDKIKMEYIVEDFLTVDEYVEMINRTKEEILDEFIDRLNYCDTHDLKADYNEISKQLVNFLTEEWRNK